jgi:hypothetical protein
MLSFESVMTIKHPTQQITSFSYATVRHNKKKTKQKTRKRIKKLENYFEFYLSLKKKKTNYCQMSNKRLMREFAALEKDPLPFILCRPDSKNLFIW